MKTVKVLPPFVGCKNKVAVKLIQRLDKRRCPQCFKLFSLKDHNGSKKEAIQACQDHYQKCNDGLLRIWHPEYRLQDGNPNQLKNIRFGIQRLKEKEEAKNKIKAIAEEHNIKIDFPDEKACLFVKF